MNNKDASVTIWIEDGLEDTQFGVTYRNSDGLTIQQYLNACRKAALGYGFSINTVNKFFPELEY